MPHPRLQFRLSTLLWITLAVACFFGGATSERKLAEWRLADRDAQKSYILDPVDVTDWVIRRRELLADENGDMPAQEPGTE